MSVFLLISIALLLLGMIATYFLAKSRPRSNFLLAAIFVTLVIGVWLFAGRNLPISQTFSKWPATARLPAGLFYIDIIGWQLSFYFLLMIDAMLMVMAAIAWREDQSVEKLISKKLVPTIVLLLTMFTLVALWSESIPGLMMTWTAVVISWLLLSWATNNYRESTTKLLTKGGHLLLPLVFLWLAVIFIADTGDYSLNSANWSTPTRMLILIAALIQLGAFPFHWWRWLRNSFSPPLAAIIHLSPTVVGAGLLTRLVQFGSTSNLFLTGFGLLGLFFAASLAWRHINKPRRVVNALVPGLVGLILLSGSWSGSPAVLLTTRVLILATAGLFLIVSWQALRPGSRPTWYLAGSVAFAAAIAGFPLTAGFVSYLLIFAAWINDGRLILIFVTIILLLPLIAATIIIVRQKGDKGKLPTLTASDNILFMVATIFLVGGLFALPDLALSSSIVFLSIMILLSGIGAYILSNYINQGRGFQEALQGALHIELPREQIAGVFSQVVSSIAIIIREAGAILEGEGGMLWLLVLVIIFWLARLSS